MLALTPSERRGALVFVLLLLLGAAHDLWRASRARRPPVPAGSAGAAWRDSSADSAVSGEPAGETAYAIPRAAPARPAPPKPIDLNRADARALDALPGVGPVLAARIVLQRRRDGPFRELEDLLAVRGVGSRLLERIRPYARLGGAPESAAAATAAGRDSAAGSTH